MRLVTPLMVVAVCTLLVCAFAASAAPVHAEKWSLWAHRISRSEAEEWRMVEMTTAAKCWARISNLKIFNVDAAVVGVHKTTGYHQDIDPYVVELTCLPNGARR